MILTILFSLTLLLNSNAIKIKDIENMYNGGKFSDALLKLQNLKTDSSNVTDTLLFYRAILEQDGEKSTKLFKELLLKFPESPYCAYALLSTAQYDFLKGSYKNALINLRRILISYPQSKYANSCRLWLGFTYEALGETTKAKQWYTKVSKNDAFIFDAAKTALAELTDRAKSIFSIQIGYFKNKESSRNLYNTFTKKGYKTWIATTIQNDVKYYRVLIGTFQTKEEAKGFANLFGQKEKTPFWIVKVKKLKQ